MTLVRLTVVHDEMQAEMLCGLLRTNGIACSYRKTDMAQGGGIGAGGGGPLEIVVDEADVDAAQAFVGET